MAAQLQAALEGAQGAAEWVVQDATASQSERWAALATAAEALLAEARAHAAAGQPVAALPDLPTAVELLCTSQPLADAELKVQLQTAAHEMQAAAAAAHHQAAAAHRSFLRQAPAGCRGSDGGSSPHGASLSGDGGSEASEAGGWSRTEHAVFLAVRTECLATGCSVAAMLECQAQRLPHRTPAELRRHKTFHKEAVRLKSAADAAAQAWRDDAAALEAAASAMLAESAAACLAAAEGAGQRLDAAVRACQNAEALAAGQAERETQAMAALGPRLRAVHAEAEAEATARQREAARLARLKHLIAGHRSNAAQQREAEAAAVAERAEREVAEAAAAAVFNRERVSFRRVLAQKRSAAAVERAGRERAAAQRRAEGLAALAATVSPAHVGRDARRAAAATASSAAAPTPPAHLFAQARGFTTEALLRDPRHRLGEALHATGLAGTSAGRAALLAVRPLHLPRPDAMTTAQLEVVGRR